MEIDLSTTLESQSICLILPNYLFDDTSFPKLSSSMNRIINQKWAITYLDNCNRRERYYVHRMFTMRKYKIHICPHLSQLPSFLSALFHFCPLLHCILFLFVLPLLELNHLAVLLLPFLSELLFPASILSSPRKQSGTGESLSCNEVLPCSDDRCGCAQPKF